MPAVPTTGNQKDFEQDTIKTVVTALGQTTVTLHSLLLRGPANAYQNGYLTVNGTSYQIVSNTDYWTDFTSGDQVIVTGMVPSSAVGQLCTLTDDDDEHLSQLGLPAPLPQNQNHANIINGIRPAFAAAYIQVEDANALGLNLNQTIAFYLNLDVTQSGSDFASEQDLTSTDTFWAFTISMGYQPAIGKDNDPNQSLDGTVFQMGENEKYPITNINEGFAAVYMESVREDTLLFMDGMSPTTLSRACFQNQKG